MGRDTYALVRNLEADEMQVVAYPKARWAVAQHS